MRDREANGRANSRMDPQGTGAKFFSDLFLPLATVWWLRAANADVRIRSSPRAAVYGAFRAVLYGFGVCARLGGLFEWNGLAGSPQGPCLDITTPPGRERVYLATGALTIPFSWQHTTRGSAELLNEYGRAKTLSGFSTR